jgi:hypothetical protein
VVVSFDAGCKKARKALASVSAKKSHITRVHLNKVTCPECRGDPSSCDCIKNRSAAGVNNTPRHLTTLVSEQQLEKQSSKYLAFRTAPAAFLHECTRSAVRLSVVCRAACLFQVQPHRQRRLSSCGKEEHSVSGARALSSHSVQASAWDAGRRSCSNRARVVC